MWLQQKSLLSKEVRLLSKFGDVNTWKMIKMILIYWLFTQLVVQHGPLLAIESQIYTVHALGLEGLKHQYHCLEKHCISKHHTLAGSDMSHNYDGHLL